MEKNESTKLLQRGRQFVLQDIEGFGQIVRSALERRREVLVFGIARRLGAFLGDGNVVRAGAFSGDSSDWIKIESLSQLRALVGGRFQNLKQRWVAAGFPLREHRGDREGKAAVDEAGWLELSLWISKQGYETRLAADTDPWLLELRKI